MPVVFRAHSAILGSGEEVTESPATIVVSDEGTITEVINSDSAQIPGAQSWPVVHIPQGQVLLPGFIDTHVHTNEPGRTEWEGFDSVTRGAAAGGVTTIIDMPLNSIPSTVSMEALEIKREIAKDKVKIDVGFWAGAVPENVGTGEIRRLWEEGRVFGFKCFLLDSGVEEFAPLDEDQLHVAMEEIAEFDGLLIVHAEDPNRIAQAHDIQQGRGGVSDVYSTFEASRPADAEATAIGAVIKAAEATGCRAHILHLSDAGSIDQIAAAKRRGVPVTVETCPHYLALLSEEVPVGATQFKCCPPIRSAANRDALWRGLVDGVIDTIGSDHSPCTVDLKRFDTGSFDQAWGGIASIQVSVPVVWTQAAERGLALVDVVRWMSTHPAAFTGLGDRGGIEVGRRADLVAFDPDESFTVSVDGLYHRNRVSAYAGQKLRGVVHATWLDGEAIYIRPSSAGVAETAESVDANADSAVFPGPLGALIPRP